MYYSSYIPTIDPIICDIYGPLSLRWYSLAYMIGMFFSWWQASKLTEIYRTKITKQDIEDFTPLAVLSVIIGGRLGHVLVYEPMSYIHKPFDIFKIYEGGMAFHGAVVGLGICIYLYFKKRNIAFLAATDLILVTAPIGIFCGRLANFVNGELYGKITDSSIGVIFFNALPVGKPRHPSQIYEALTEGLLLYFIMLLLVYRYNKLNDRGFITGLWCMLYSLFRFIIEYYREPDGLVDLYFTEISTGQTLCLIMGFVGGAVLLYRRQLNHI